MNATLGDWLFTTLGAKRTRALLKEPRQGEPANPPHPPVSGDFHPDQGAVPDLQGNPVAFKARYELPFSDLWGSEIGEGAVPDKSEIQERVRRADNPCSLNNNQNYVVTEIDILDFRYVARSGRPVWEAVRSLHIFDPDGGDPETECQRQLQAARAEIAALKTEVARLGKLVPVAVPADIDKTVALLKGAGPVLEIGPGVKARFGRLGRFVDALKERKP